MDELADRRDPHEEMRRSVDEFLNPEYLKKTGEKNSRLDFMEALDIYLSDEAEESEDIHYLVKSYLSTLKDIGVRDKMMQKAEEENIDLTELMDKNLNLDDDEAGDKVLALLRETLG